MFPLLATLFLGGGEGGGGEHPDRARALRRLWMEGIDSNCVPSHGLTWVRVSVLVSVSTLWVYPSTLLYDTLHG